MKIQFLLVTTIALASSTLGAWGGKNQKAVPTAESDIHFPLSPDQEWFTVESYLLWKPYVRDMDFGRRQSLTVIAANQDAFVVKPKRPSFDWSSGVRVGIGKYLPNHDLWDIDAYATYLYSDGERTVTPNLPDTFSPDYSFYDTSITTQIASNDSTGHWRMNYFTWDLSLGRLFNLPHSITLHPFVAIRGAMINQSYRISHEGVAFTGVGPFRRQESMTDSYKGTNDYWGIGPRAGAGFTFEFEKHWALLGEVAGSILYGHYKVKERINNSVQVGTFVPDFTYLTAKDHDYVIRTNLETSFGLGWETWFNNNTVRFAPSVMFEAGIWYAMNQFYDFTIVNDGFDYLPNRRHGNLVYAGFNFNLQVDF